MIIFLILVILIWIIFSKKIEFFDRHTREFVPVGYTRFGLRGDLLKKSLLDKYYIRPNRHIRLSQSGSMMRENNCPPKDKYMEECQKVPCPDVDEYDDLDTCWKCGMKQFKKKDSRNMATCTKLIVPN